MADRTDPLQLNIERLKRDAKRLRKAGTLPLHKCLDAQAKAHGYANWPQLVNAYDKSVEVRHG